MRVLEARGLGKEYALGGGHAEVRHLRAFLAGLVRGGAAAREAARFWALRDVDLDLDTGEVLGVIGRNGSGKSTLLKLIGGIAAPSAGEVRVRGRVGSLLEVGTGFHPELTGRENVYLNGSILGMSRREVQARFDVIADFAGVERFLDTPVKHYSSGMRVRLGFAVAAHLDPEILLVDEVLAVGDLAFQKRCLGRMEEIARGGTRSVLFVSHNLASVQALCTRCILLEAGRVVHVGTPAECIDRYVGSAREAVSLGDLGAFRRPSVAPDAAVRFAAVEVRGGRRQEDGTVLLESGDPLRLRFDLEAREEVRDAAICVMITRGGSERVATLYSRDEDAAIDLDPGTTTWEVAVDGVHLGPGEYFADLFVRRGHQGTAAFDELHTVPLLQVDQVPATGGLYPNRSWGVVHWPGARWSRGEAA